MPIPIHRDHFDDNQDGWRVGLIIHTGYQSSFLTIIGKSEQYGKISGVIVTER